MAHELVIYIIVLIFGGLLSSFLCIYGLWKLKHAPGATFYSLVTFLSTIFSFAYAFELTSTTLEQIKFWLSIQYLALPFIPLFILLMSIEYVGRKLHPWVVYPSFVIPIMTVFMHHTNDLHFLYYRSVQLRNDTPFPIVYLDGGPFFYVHSVFMLVCLVASMFILLMHLKKSVPYFRIQIMLMVIGILVPLVGADLYLNELAPYGIDLGPVLLSVTFLLHGMALVLYQMFNVVPIARDTVFESMREGVIVLNQNDIIVDYNHSAAVVFPVLTNQMLGKPITDILNENPQLIYIIEKKEECDFPLLVHQTVIHYNVHFSPIFNKSHVIIGYILTFVNITERMILQERLTELATIDGLTGLLNRTSFFSQTKELLLTSLSREQNLSIILFDIDHFKQVNDTYGHAGGDAVLTHVVAVVKSLLRETDLFGRYGGEEFVICLPDTTVDEAKQLANVIRVAIMDSSIDYEDSSIRVTSSFGISTVCPHYNITIETLIKQADNALYFAKGNGRNRVEAFKHQVLV